MNYLVYLAIAAPAGAFLVNAVVVRWVPSKFGGGPASSVAGWITVASVAFAFVLSLVVLSNVLTGGEAYYAGFSLLEVGSLEISYGLLLDPAAAIMLTLVSGISLLVQIYSLGYMAHDPSRTRFFAYMALFTASMLGLVSANNLVVLFVYWEMVGICSYLLIGYWGHKPSAAAAAKKAFLMTRIGDFGFLVALMLLASLNFEWLELNTLYAAAQGGLITIAAATWLSLGFMLGALGKSAQLPLHSWLADAMEGPSPVSALLHSATMVTAGVFLVARLFPLFEAGNLNTVLSVIGATTALFGASLALVSTDIKRVLAYSTISQIGYMLFALGIGAYAAALLHLFTHAFFKAGLFMVAGMVGHSTGTYDMLKMGGLRRRMPYTYGIALVCGLSLAAIFPLAGFWSKDEIIGHGLHVEAWLLTALVLLVSVLTAFYIARLILLTFHGTYRGDQSAAQTRESNWFMLVPVGVLAVGAVVVGFVINPPWFDFGPIVQHGFSKFVTVANGPLFADLAAALEAGGGAEFNGLGAIISTALAATGLSLAVYAYGRGATRFEIAHRGVLGVLHKLLVRKYYVDDLYEKVLATNLTYRWAAQRMSTMDLGFFDGINLKLSTCAAFMARLVVNTQTGRLQSYGSLMLLGAGLVVLLFYFWSRG